jgi:hypothetical protein
MERKQNRGGRLGPKGVSRRDFLKAAAAVGLLAGCGSAQQPVAMPTSEPTHTPTPTLNVLGKVVRARHAGVWNGEALAPEAVRQMLDSSITGLIGLDDVGRAWATLFDPGERVAVKVNTIRSSHFWTRVPLVMAVTERLQEVGIPPEQIVIFDRSTSELEGAGYPINKDGPGLRCYGTDKEYTPGWSIMDTDIGFSQILLECDALINMPILKQHSISGISFAMKNHYGAFDKPLQFHGQKLKQALPELNALQPIQDRIRLIIGDALSIVETGWSSAVPGDSILMSFDPVAHDTVGLELYLAAIGSESYSAKRAMPLATPWLEYGAELGLGINDPADMELVELNLG